MPKGIAPKIQQPFYSPWVQRSCGLPLTSRSIMSMKMHQGTRANQTIKLFPTAYDARTTHCVFYSSQKFLEAYQKATKFQGMLV